MGSTRALRLPLLLVLLALASCGRGRELRVAMWENGSPRHRGRVHELDCGLQATTGRWLFWYPDGQLQARGSFRDGPTVLTADPGGACTLIPRAARTGEWAAWAPDGSQEWKGSYHDGRREGTWTWWHPNGRVRLQGGFLAGRENGRHVRYHPNGRVAVEEVYSAGRRVGRRRVWDAGGNLLEDALLGHELPGHE